MKTIFYSLFFILMLSLNTSVYAEPGDISKQEAVAIATRDHPGRVLSVKRKTHAYQIKILSDSGKVQVVKVDIKSGEVKSRPRADAQEGSDTQR